MMMTWRSVLIRHHDRLRGRMLAERDRRDCVERAYFDAIRPNADRCDLNAFLLLMRLSTLASFVENLAEIVLFQSPVRR